VPDPQPRIAIDARYWRGSIQTGVERYIHLLLEALAAAGADPLEVGLVLAEREAPAFRAGSRPGLRVRTVTVPDKRGASLGRALDALSPDVVHFPFDLPARLTHPSVFTLHDAGRYLFPEQMVAAVRDVQNGRLTAHLADPLLRSVITVSEASRRDITRVLGDLPKPLEVVPNFVSRDFARLLAADHRAPAGQEPFLLGVGVYMPSKNVPGLVRAFRRARTLAPGSVPARLLLAGRRGWERALPSAQDPAVTVLGHIDDTELAALYGQAAAFVFPTLFEGFGIPAQEALAAGRPLLCSDLPVLREVTGDLAQYVDPRDDEALAKGIIAISSAAPAPPGAVRSLLERYSPETIGPDLLALYRRASRQA